MTEAFLLDIDGTLLSTTAGYQALQSVLVQRIGPELALSSLDLAGQTDRWIVRAALQTRQEHVDENDIPFLSRIDGADPFDAVRRQEIARRIERGLVELPPYHRGVIVMREVHGMSYEEMADAMGVSKGTIMSRLFHARQKLQRALSDCYREHIGPPPCLKEKP